MIAHLLNGVLPVFAVGGLGYILGKRGTFTFEMAMAINKFVMFVAMPALVVQLLTKAPLEEFNFGMLGGYFVTELILYVGGFIIGRYLFNTDVKEAALLGLALALTNHVLFVLPIAQTLFGEDAVTPIVAIISMDGILLFSGTIVLMDILATRDSSLRHTIGKIVSNPPLIAMLLGLAIGLSGWALPTGVDVFLGFLAATASPVLLFALGVILSQPQAEGRTSLPITISGLKLIVHPALALLIFTSVLNLKPEILTPAMMVAAAPCGVMAFMLALNYQVRVDAIARAILYTSIGSLVTVTIAAGI